MAESADHYTAKGHYHILAKRIKATAKSADPQTAKGLYHILAEIKAQQNQQNIR